MKKLMLVLMLGSIAFNGFSAPKKATKEVTAITEMKPLVTTAPEVEHVLGKPDKTYETKGQKLWQYTKGNMNIQVNLDEAGTVKLVNFYSNEKINENWTGENAKELLTGKTNYRQVVTSLGNPQNMSIDKHAQRLQYQFEDNILQLYFIDGVLLKYELHGKG